MIRDEIKFYHKYDNHKYNNRIFDNFIGVLKNKH